MNSFDWLAGFLFAAFIATFVIVLVNAYDNKPDWW